MDAFFCRHEGRLGLALCVQRCRREWCHGENISHSSSRYYCYLHHLPGLAWPDLGWLDLTCSLLSALCLHVYAMCTHRSISTIATPPSQIRSLCGLVNPASSRSEALTRLTVQENAIFALPFYATKNHPFAKAGSGQTQGKLFKRDAFSLGTKGDQPRGNQIIRNLVHEIGIFGKQVRNTPLLVPLYTRNDHFAETGSGQT